MEKIEIEELERVVNEELKLVDIYRHSITRSEIEHIRRYFSNDKGLNVSIESSNPRILEELSKKYTAVFKKSE